MSDASSSAPRRLPKPVYREHNGFTESVELKMAGTGPPPRNLHTIAANPQNASKQELRELRDAVQRRQFVEDMMELKGTYFPGMDAIRQANETPDTYASVKEHIQELKRKHVEEVLTLHEWHAQDYYDEALDMSRSKPDIEDPGVESFYRTSRSSYDLAASFDDELDKHHYAYLLSLFPLINKSKELRKSEEETRKRRDQQFPATIAEFHAIRNKDVQFRIARFLTADDSAKERTMDEFKWAWRQVQPLITEYNQNDEFKAEIKALLQERMRDIEVRDPRKAKLASGAT